MYVRDVSPMAAIYAEDAAGVGWWCGVVIAPWIGSHIMVYSIWRTAGLNTVLVLGAVLPPVAIMLLWQYQVAPRWASHYLIGLTVGSLIVSLLMSVAGMRRMQSAVNNEAATHSQALLGHDAALEDLEIGAALDQTGNSNTMSQRTDVTGEMRDVMQALVNGTCHPSRLGHGIDQREAGNYRRLDVLKVERIKNPTLWNKYRAERQAQYRQEAVAASLGISTTTFGTNGLPVTFNSLGPEFDFEESVNECLLFHSTSADKAKLICETGFENRIANNGLYGAGCYFAEDSSKSDQYAQASETVFPMFVARVTLGQYPMVTQIGFDDRILPEIKAGSGIRYTSLIGESGVHREFVVYEKAQAFPEYLLW